MKTLSQYINEYLIKKKLDKVHNDYEYTPKTKEELENIVKKLAKQGETNFNNINTSNIDDMSWLFEDKIFSEIEFDVSEWDVSKVKNMQVMFYKCHKFDCDLSNWDVSKVEDMSYMFTNCDNFTGKGLAQWNTYKVKNMNHMFSNCNKLECDLEHWNVSNCKDIRNMFAWCNNMKNKPSWYKE